jgi:hypothetical protein
MNSRLTVYEILSMPHRRFVALFGVCEQTVSHLWQTLLQHDDFRFQLIHLLWTLHWMKNYDADSVMATVWGADEKTIHLWIHRTIEVLSQTLCSVCVHLLNYTCKLI